jgi:sugar/nucleoside kinase (ribokinase family)
MTSPRFDVLSYGTIGVDRILRVPHWPSPEISTHTLSESIYLGGKATNAAAFLAEWGTRVAVSGTILGDDDTGKLFFGLLEGYPDIATDYLEQRQELSSMYCCILVNPAGERAIIGVNTDNIITSKPTAEMISDALVLTLDLYGGAERIEAARLAFEANRPVVIGDLRDVDHPVLPYTSVAIASAAEVRAGHPNRNTADFARQVQQVGNIDVIVTDGASPVTIFTKDGNTATLHPPTVQVIDTTGAGDALRAGVTYGVLHGLDIVESAALGAAAGSINVQHEGAASRLPNLATVEALAEQILRTTIRL